MDDEFKQKVYTFSTQIIQTILKDFNGKTVGSDEMDLETIMCQLSGKPKVKPIIQEYINELSDNEENVDKEIIDEEEIITDKSLFNFERCDVFTPDDISKVMSSYLTDKGKLLEPSVGDGQLLKFTDFYNYSQVDIYDIKQEYLDKCPEHPNIKSYCQDFLKKKINHKYENIILNPPYIRFQDLSEDYREYIKETWPILDTGNIDIYYAFLVKCLEVLSDDGIMVAIIPNSYLTTNSAKLLRKFFIKNRYISEIIDFKSDKVFHDVSTYCCITVFTKQKKTEILYRYKNRKKLIQYDDISENDYNIFIKKNDGGKTLDDICKMKGGIATLRDKIYIHEKKLYNEPCWKKATNSMGQLWIIFPYHENGKIIEEEEFKTNNPKTYQHLLDNKEELLKRDRGKQDKYPTWYCYGRTQSLIKETCEKVIYVATFVDPDDIKYTTAKPQYHVGSIAIQVIDENYTRGMVIDILERNKQFLIDNTTKRGGGWLNLSSGVLKKVPV